MLCAVTCSVAGKMAGLSVVGRTEDSGGADVFMDATLAAGFKKEYCCVAGAAELLGTAG